MYDDNITQGWIVIEIPAMLTLKIYLSYNFRLCYKFVLKGIFFFRSIICMVLTKVIMYYGAFVIELTSKAESVFVEFFLFIYDEFIVQ